MAQWVAQLVAHDWPTTGPVPISIGNNLISDLAYLFRKKPLPKSKFGLAFSRTWKSKTFLATHFDYFSDYFEAGLSNSGIVFVAMQEQLPKSNLGNSYLPRGNGQTKIRLCPLDEIWICFCLLSQVNTWIRILNSASDICRCEKRNHYLFISRGNILISSEGEKLPCLRCEANLQQSPKAEFESPSGSYPTTASSRLKFCFSYGEP